MKKIWIVLLGIIFLTGCGKQPVVPVAEETPPPVAVAPTVTPTATPTSVPSATPVAATEKPAKQTAAPIVPTAEPKEEIPAVIDTVSMVITGETELLRVAAVPLEGETAVKFLQRIAAENGIPVRVRGSGKLSYVVAIGNLSEFDKGPESGWTYYVNGTYMLVGAGNVPVRAGDFVEWKYKFE
jgi:hypothetical protein